MKGCLRNTEEAQFARLCKAARVRVMTVERSRVGNPAEMMLISPLAHSSRQSTRAVYRGATLDSISSRADTPSSVSRRRTDERFSLLHLLAQPRDFHAVLKLRAQGFTERTRRALTLAAAV